MQGNSICLVTAVFFPLFYRLGIFHNKKICVPEARATKIQGKRKPLGTLEDLRSSLGFVIDSELGPLNAICNNTSSSKHTCVLDTMFQAQSEHFT